MEFSDLMSEYTLPPAMRERLSNAFSELDTRSVAYALEKGKNLFDGARSRDKERAYRALNSYAAQVVSDLFAMEGGQELHRQVVEVMTEERQGVLLKGLPEDTGIKSLFVLGMKTLIGDNVNTREFFSPTLPQVISRGSTGKYWFHRDGNPHLDSPEDRSFLFIGLAQQQASDTPTLFKPAGNNDRDHVAHNFTADEIMLLNNKSIEHSPAIIRGGALRQLFRYIVHESRLSHSTQDVGHVRTLMEEAGVPQEQNALKAWLIQEIGKLEKPLSR